ncbi:LytTR family transcriptional regulator DNA-binding domain-containing protein [uncultured Polaribacter sp.]|uniref:LytTR family transcriptional regulator DNA-binding domain-containing protein n=1 Tax=uncultured Polaribacter sp. TaxID=174711 RepID=UPI0026396DAF|nr:LytTR family transcriptional regulator DNA-binding domain-containing protein [uncultured Polaribacter sp.]
MPNKFNILIVEDNVIIADDLQQIIESFGYRVLGNVISYEKAVETLTNNNNIDLVLIDINLATEKTGIDLAKYINLNLHLPFIFLSSNLDDDTVSEAANTFPSAYLVKPFDNNTIYTSIEVALTGFTNNRLEKKTQVDHLYLKKNNLYYKVKIGDITFIKSDNIYLEIHTENNEKFLLRSTLKDFFKSLPNNFFKCNKSYIININKVNTFNLNYVFINNTQISVSKEFKPYLKSLLK